MKTTLLLCLCATLTACAGLAPRPAGDAAVQRLVSEDDQVRITELRVRGQTQRISVDPKDSTAPRYEITPQAAGSDPSAARTGAGQRVWTVLSF
jgi:outer membrane biogenesis lipoprotein LolB